MKIRQWICSLAVLATAMLSTSHVAAQDLTSSIEDIFSDVLDISTNGPQNAHGEHFKPNNVESSETIISALSSFISTNISTFPLSSSSTGLTFDFSGAVPVAIANSAGPIFAERPQTLGKGRLNVGVTASYLNLARIRGLKTDEIRFNFLHEDVPPPGGTELGIFGDNPNEFDHIELDLDLDVDATVLALQGAFGLTDRFDIGVSVPIVKVSVFADPTARIESITFLTQGAANHFFDGTSAEPVLTLAPTSIDESASGIGDIAVFTKYNFHQGGQTAVSVLAEVRLPTGREEDFLGTGETNVRGMLIVGTTVGTFSPHLNVGFDYRASDLDLNEFELALGLEQQIGEQVTLVVDWMGEFEIGDPIDELQFPEPTEIGTDEIIKTVESTNIPNIARDHILRTSVGIKYTPRSNIILLANVIVPNNTGGLRSDAIVTLGASLFY